VAVGLALVLGIVLWLALSPGKEVTKYKVSFDSRGGSAVSEVVVESGKTFVAPADPTFEGKTFGGWYKANDLGVKWDFAKDTVTKDITLYAKWSGTEVPDGFVLVSFDLNGGTLDGKDTYEQRVLQDSLMTPPNDPVRDGWVFGAWLLDGEVYGFDKPVTQAMTLVADWRGFETRILDDGTMEIKGIGTIERVTGGVLRIPQSIDGVRVTSIGELAFCPQDDDGNVYEGGDWFVEAVLPEGLVNIGDNAFLNNATYLTTINLPSTLKTIGKKGINGCGRLVFEEGVLRLPNGLETIGDKAFLAGGSMIAKVFIPKSVINMGDAVFYGGVAKEIYCEATDPSVDPESTASGWVQGWDRNTGVTNVVHWGASDVE